MHGRKNARAGSVARLKTAQEEEKEKPTVCGLHLAVGASRPVVQRMESCSTRHLKKKARRIGPWRASGGDATVGPGVGPRSLLKLAFFWACLFGP